MSIAELKKTIIGKIEHSDDFNLLDDILQILQLGEKDILYLSSEQKNAIARAEDEIKQGKSYTNEQVQQKIEGWLGK